MDGSMDVWMETYQACLSMKCQILPFSAQYLTGDRWCLYCSPCSLCLHGGNSQSKWQFCFQSKSLRIWPPALLDKRNFLSPWLWNTTLSWFFSQTSGYLFIGFSSFSASPQELGTHSCSSTHPIQIGGKCCHYSNELFWWCLSGEHIVSTDLPPPAGHRSQLVLFRNSARLHLSPSS